MIDGEELLRLEQEGEHDAALAEYAEENMPRGVERCLRDGGDVTAAAKFKGHATAESEYADAKRIVEMLRENLVASRSTSRQES